MTSFYLAYMLYHKSYDFSHTTCDIAYKPYGPLFDHFGALHISNF